MKSHSPFTAAAEPAGPSIPPRAEAPTKQQAAFLQLVQNKPPANLDGLLGFVSDLRRRGRYTDAESEAMLRCESGRILAVAIRQCEGLRREVRQRVAEGGSTNGSGRDDRSTTATADAATDGTSRTASTHVVDDAGAARKQKEMLQQATYRYLDCLSYLSCPGRWRTYTSCWSDLGGLTVAQAAELHRSGVGLEVVCQRERTDLERCVGNHVSSAVRHAAECRDADDLF
jgi:hypothetical protein